jgi:hypothetical protein
MASSLNFQAVPQSPVSEVSRRQDRVRNSSHRRTWALVAPHRLKKRGADRPRKTHDLYQGTTVEAAEKHRGSPEGTVESSPGRSPGKLHASRVVPKGRLKTLKTASWAPFSRPSGTESTLQNIPRTASWATFNRPFGTKTPDLRGGLSSQRRKPKPLETMYVRAEARTLQKTKKKKPQISPLRSPRFPV